MKRLLTRAVLGSAFLALGACGTPSAMQQGSSWDKPSGRFTWTQGEVRVPAGLYYRDGHGVDSFEGEFHTLDEALVIRHDIGGLAGAYAQGADALFFEERIVGDARVWIAETKRGPASAPSYSAAVTFPDNGCANFMIDSRDHSGRDQIRRIAETFKPIRTQRATTNSCPQRPRTVQ